MIQVSILEKLDIVRADDWCRPLQLTSMSGGLSDSYSFKSCYSGSPENNVKWVRVDVVMGWVGETVGTINRELGRYGTTYEFVRGEIPASSRLSMKGYRSLRRFSYFSRGTDDVSDDIPF